MSINRTESRSERVQRLKRKFQSLGVGRLLREYVRYEKAEKGELPHGFPDEYASDCGLAILELLMEHRCFQNNFDRLLHHIARERKNPSEPFMKD